MVWLDWALSCCGTLLEQGRAAACHGQRRAWTLGICAIFRSRVQVLGEPPAVSEEVQALMNEAGITDLQKSGLLYLSNDARVRPLSHRA